MKNFVNKNYKLVSFICLLAITVTYIVDVSFSYAIDNSNNQIYTRDELSNNYAILNNRVTSLEDKTTDAYYFLKSYPVGSIYMTINDSNPSATYGGTWVAWGSGQVPVGVDGSNNKFNIVEKTGGNSSIMITESNLPPAVIYDLGAKDLPASGNVALRWEANDPNTYWLAASLYYIHGANESYSPIDVTNPYITCYMWKRIA